MYQTRSVSTPLAYNIHILDVARWIVVATLIGLFVTPVSAQEKATKEATSIVQDSLPAPGSMGWAAFTQADRHNLDLTEEQLRKLKEMDSRFEPKYNAMGIEPWTNEKFPELNGDRNKAVQDVLTPEQYQRWAKPTTPVPATPPTIIPATTPEK